MRIGPYNINNNLCLAPMAGVTDRPFRILCKRFGAGLTVSEMVSSNTTLWGHRKTLRRLDHRGEEGPITVQIVGADPRTMAEAARINVAHGAQIVDINMGCPAKKVCKVAAGSALLRDERLVGRILDRVVAAVDVPVTLKMRTGWDPQHRNGVEIARLAEQAGIQAIAVHGRTRACGYSGLADYDTIRAIKAAVDIPVIANGDIDGPRKAKEVLSQTGADALMIGRAARGRPWIFGQIRHYLKHGEQLPAPNTEQVREILLEHLAALYEFYGRDLGARVARKHIAWYSRGYRDGAGLRRAINQADTLQKQLTLIGAFFDRVADKQEDFAA